MKLNSVYFKSIILEAHAGVTIEQAAREAISLACEHGCLVSFRFNDKLLSCEPWDKVEDKVKEYLAPSKKGN